eukprot:gene33061-42490_t
MIYGNPSTDQKPKQLSTLMEESWQDAVTSSNVEELELANALASDQFTLLFQPILSLSTHKIVSAEALIRWNHPILGTVSPEHFIHVAEKTGLINDIGAWVMEQACKQLSSWEKNGLVLQLTINVSARQISTGLTPAMALDAMARHCISPSSLVFEITESYALADVSDAREWIDQMRALGFCVYLDDFGIKHSTLLRLHQFSVDAIKIDKSFLDDVTNNKMHYILLNGMIQLIKAMNLVVIVEGLETMEQLEVLQNFGCTRVQGYLLSKPCGAYEVENMAR